MSSMWAKRCLLMKVAESTVSPALLTTVPHAIRTALKIEVGDILEWHVENNEVKVRRKKQ